MKNIIKYSLIVIFIFLFAYIIFSKVIPLESFTLGESNAIISNYYNNKNYPTSLSIIYNQKIDEKNRITELIEIYFNDYLNRSCISINAKDRKKFLKLIDKALDGVKSQNEKLKMDIGEFNIGISWKNGNQDWIETEKNKIFFKVQTGIDKTNEMVLSFSEAVMENEKYKPGILFLKEESINDLEKALSDNNYNSLLKNAKPK